MQSKQRILTPDQEEFHFNEEERAGMMIKGIVDLENLLSNLITYNYESLSEEAIGFLSQACSNATNFLYTRFGEGYRRENTIATPSDSILTGNPDQLISDGDRDYSSVEDSNSFNTFLREELHSILQNMFQAILLDRRHGLTSLDTNLQTSTQNLTTQDIQVGPYSGLEGSFRDDEYSAIIQGVFIPMMRALESLP
jgi:hypothetical protein